jgi:hypothetical protein
VARYRRPLSLYFGPSEVLVNLDVHFLDDLSSDEIELTIEGIEARIREKLPVVNRIFVEADRIRKQPLAADLPHDEPQAPQA